jgi:hypothetical protein
MPDRNTRWENDKEWFGWTIRDEIYGYVREHWLPTIMAAIIGGAGSAFSFITSHPTLAAWLGAPTLTILVIVALSWIDGRRRRMIEPESATSGSALSVPNEHEPQPHVELPKKNIPPETREALDAMASALHWRPVEPAPASLKINADVQVSRPRWAQDGYVPTHEDLAIVYGVDKQRGIVTLKFQSDRPSKHEDALFLLLYGYKLLLNIDNVEVWKLNQSLADSGCRKELSNLDVDRLADSSVEHGMLRKHGLSRGGFYSFCETGLGKARILFIYMRDRA